MTGERLGRRLLRLDAAYCAVGGLIALVLVAPLASLLGVAEVVLAGSGALSIAWALVLLVLARRPEWRVAVTGVAAINVAAAGGIGALAVLMPALAAQLLLAAVALEVAALAAGQLAAARR